MAAWRVTLTVLALLMASAAAATGNVPKLNLEAEVTVSGVSAGAFMATQFHVAFSNMVHGLGAIAGGPFYCANADLGVALSACMKNKPAVNVAELVVVAHNTAAFGFIDPLSNLQDDRVWVFSALNDTIVATGVVQSVADWYGYFVQDRDEQIMEVMDVAGEHSQVTAFFGNACQKLATPYINNCHYDATGSMLQHLYDSSLKTPANHSFSGSFVPVSQKAFTGGLPWTSLYGLNDEAYLYIPTACANGALCKLHIAYHGCSQSVLTIGMAYIKDAGYNSWADANNFVILYPQNAAIADINPLGCWDWWGYTGTDYASQEGIQMLVVNNIMKALVDQ